MRLSQTVAYCGLSDV